MSFPQFVWSGKDGEHRWAQAIDAFIRPGQQHVAIGPARSFHASRGGDRVSFVVPATLSIGPAHQTEDRVEQALWLFVLTRFGDQWKIAADTWTSTGPAPGAATALRQERGALFVEAMADGVGPMLFVLDPGGKDTYTRSLRDRLHGRAPETLCVAQACFRAAMSFMDGDPQQLVPSHDPAAGEIAGSIGLQMLRNYAVTIDYDRSTVTLTPPGAFRAPADARKFALSFDAFDQPAIQAAVDGIGGLFEIDVRARTSMLFSPFLDRTGLRRTYDRAPVVQQSGTLVAHAVRRVDVGGVTVRDVPFWFSTESAGKFANPRAAGLLANSVLAHFVVTFDVPHRAVYLGRFRASS